MDIIISLLIVSVLIGIPTWLIVHTVNKADKSTIIYSPEEVTRRLRKGFYLSFWGMDLLFGAIPSFVLILCDLPTVFQFIVPAVAFIVGFIMFFIGRIQVGLMTRYINFCNRERTEFEEWVLQAMLGIEEAAMRRNGINVITKVIPGVTDDMLSAMNSMGIIRRREYNLSDIASSNEKIEEFYKDYGDGNVTSSWDKVTTFYNKQGKKLFKFGLAYDNIQLLVKEVKNTQKSISNQKRKK